MSSRNPVAAIVTKVNGKIQEYEKTYYLMDVSTCYLLFEQYLQGRASVYILNPCLDEVLRKVYEDTWRR